MLLGAELKDGQRVVMVEDVTTSGKSIEETYPMITSIAKIEVVGLIVSLNRMEVGKGGKVAALQESPSAGACNCSHCLHGRGYRGPL